MARVLLFLVLIVSLLLSPSSAADAGGSNYEPTHPPRIMPAATDARSFYAEFRARDEAGGFGHSYITLGIVRLNGEMRQTVSGRLHAHEHDRRLMEPVRPTGHWSGWRSTIRHRPTTRRSLPDSDQQSKLLSNSQQDPRNAADVEHIRTFA